MTSQEDLGMVWYGMSGVPFNPADPAEVMLNTGTTAPLLSDHPRSIVASHITQDHIGSHHTIATYGDPSTLPHHSQMLYDANTGDYISQADYMYETYDSYEDDNAGNMLIANSQNAVLTNQQASQGCSGNEDETGCHPRTKKPKVHQHPALKLKTPIAYQKDTDLDAIPIMKEGMAVCEKCGAIGVRHAFYGKERKFCSLVCARPPMQNSFIAKGNSLDMSKLSKLNINRKDTTGRDDESRNKNKEVCINFGEESEEFTILANNDSLMDNISNGMTFPPQNSNLDGSNLSSNNQAEYFNEVPSLLENESPMMQHSMRTLSSSALAASIKTDLPRATATYLSNNTMDLSTTYDWELTYLSAEDFVGAPVQCFKHAPMNECWEQISAGMKVEVSCREESLMKDAFWVATVVKITGYKANLRYEGFIDDSSKDFWVDLCSEEVHPVGWCATLGKPLIPPKSIQYKYSDWKDFLMRRLTGARTLPTNFQNRVLESQKSRFRPGLNLEVVDKNRIAQMRVATVTEVIGKRLHLRYHGAPPDDNGFWCHEDSSIIHPVGWSREVGHEIVASQSYHEKCMEVSYEPEDAAPDLFVTPLKFSTFKSNEFLKGMKLEAIDPLNLSTICVATVMKVLCNNYLMIRIDSYDNDNTCSDWFCYHATSPNIFPAGFCDSNGITLTPPKGYEGQFSWNDYLAKTKATVAAPSLFSREEPDHGLDVGMSIEAADLMDPRLVCVAKIKVVKGRLLKIHFDGWEDDFDQWADCVSPDIYPVGWCKMVGYKLEGPRVSVSASYLPKRRTRGRGSGRKGRPFVRKVGMNRDIENSSPLTPSDVASVHTINKRGRKPRHRGSCHIGKFRDESSDFKDDLVEQDSSSGLYGENEVKGKRGRPRKNPLRVNNHHSIGGLRLPRTSGTILSTYAQSEDEGSDETSSGVASLADSEASADFWDEDDAASNSEHVSNENQIRNIKNNSDCSSIKEPTISSLVDVPDTGYREALTFGGIVESVLLDDETPSLQNIFSSCEDTIVSDDMVDNMCSDLQVSNSHQTTQGCIDPPNETKMMSYESNSPLLSSYSSSFELAACTGNTKENFIPRIVDNANILRGGKAQPNLWSQEDVANFLRLNDCGSYCDTFIANKIDGNKLLKLSQNEVMVLVGMKVGPSVKINDLIQQLLAIVNPAQARYQATLIKRGLTFGKS